MVLADSPSVAGRSLVLPLQLSPSVSHHHSKHFQFSQGHSLTWGPQVRYPVLFSGECSLPGSFSLTLPVGPSPCLLDASASHPVHSVEMPLASLGLTMGDIRGEA